MAVASLADGYRARFPGHPNQSSVCSRYMTGFSIGCNPCWLRSQYNARLLFLDDHTYGHIDIARQCALKSWEGSRSAATRPHSGFATPQGACHPSKPLAGPDLTELAKSEQVCKAFEVVRPFDSGAKLAWIMHSPDCRIDSNRTTRLDAAPLALEEVSHPQRD